MENNSNESGKPRETVTLILKEERFEVEKQKLIDKSQYFAALLFANFLEYKQTEHVINYDISPISLQDFIDWIHHDIRILFKSAANYDSEELLDRFLSLLELSVLFTADKLKDDITDRLERRFMSPKYAIEIWLLAQELNINVLRDLSLAVCLDRFLELPHNSIYELSEEHFLKLIGNVNVRATETYLLDIIIQWKNHHHSFTAPFDIIVLKKKAILDILRNKKAKILHGIISCKHNNHEQFIHCWDGNDFFELTSFEYPPDIIKHCSSTGKPLEGMQITARRYDLYLCGGEYGIGSGMFNKNVWRYSLISKKWILETVMPVERRDMITVFLKEKLYLVGGVGHIEEVLQTVDIYDIYTGKWTSGAKVPNYTYSFLNDLPSDLHANSDRRMIFKWSIYRSLCEGVPVVVTSSSKHFIFKDTLIICKLAFTYIYCPDKDVWKEIDICKLQCDPTNIPILALQTVSCYIDVVDQDKMVLKVVTDTCNVKGCNNIIKTFSKSIHGEKKINMDGSFFLTPFFREPFHGERPAGLLYADHIIRNKTLHLHSISIQDPKKFRSLCFTSKNSIKGFFNLNLLHPAHLHTTMNLDHI
ncbi:kelch-like protein 38 [Temnothorax longispinosus]|uniref:kelch-like protein 38 n=1 Tax=Temnothorax longispinosus TaxID=300112 RepID=UPI003A99EA9F